MTRSPTNKGVVRFPHEPVKALWWASVEDAIECAAGLGDLHDYNGANREKMRDKIAKEALRWIACPVESDPRAGSLQWICEHLRLPLSRVQVWAIKQVGRLRKKRACPVEAGTEQGNPPAQ